MYLRSSWRRSSPLLASSARAAGPAATVTVRVEGSRRRRSLPRTTVTTPTHRRQGRPRRLRAPHERAGALERRHRGELGRPLVLGLRLLLESILGESHTFASDHYWAMFIDGSPRGNGAAADELSRRATSVLCSSGRRPTAASPCFGEPLHLAGARHAAPGAPFNVTVTESHDRLSTGVTHASRRRARTVAAGAPRDDRRAMARRAALARRGAGDASRRPSPARASDDSAS